MTVAEDPNLVSLSAHQPLDGAERTLFGKDGTAVSAAIWLAPQRARPGEAAGFIYIIADIGPRKQLEQQRRDSYKLEAVSRLAAGVAHNFNNLLAIITGYGDFALESLPDGAPVRNEIQEVLKAARRAAGLTVQLLAFGRQQPARPRIVELNRVVSDLKEVLQKIAGPGTEVVTSLGAGLGDVRIDPEQIEQVLVTLVVNARDAIAGAGWIVLETANANVEDQTRREHLDVKSGPYVVLSVSDNGPGMDAQTREHLFEPFFTTKGLGTSGLGLSSVYGIAKQNGGGVAAISQPGQGTRIEIYLPRI
jgi:signal transduction histidine kinase